MENTVTIDTFPITEDMYQLKSIDIINSNFLSLKNWHDAFDDYCKMNDELSVRRFNIENANYIQTADLEADHIKSTQTYTPTGTVKNETRSLFEMSDSVFMYKNFVIDEEGMHLPTENFGVITESTWETDTKNINKMLQNPGKYANGLTRTIINSSSHTVGIQNISGGITVYLNPGHALEVILYEGVWYQK